MKKQFIHVYIDIEDYYKLKSQPDLNISALVRNLLKAYIQGEKREVSEENNIIKEINQLTNQAEEVQKDIAIKKAQLMEIQEIREKEDEEEDARNVAVSKAIKNSRMLEGLFDK